MMRKMILKIVPRKYLVLLYRIFLAFFSFNIFKFIKGYIGYILDLLKYKSKEGTEKIKIINLYPIIYEKTPTTPIDFYYFYQDTWCAYKIFQNKPIYHVDIGSTYLLVGILSQFTKVCSVDIRPLDVKLAGLECKKGSLTNLPFADNTIESLSSLCVLEHVGLGRYGDEIDPKATNKAISELQRIITPGGNLYLSVPIDKGDTIYFNAHKAFEYNSFVKRFTDMDIVEVKFIQKNAMYNLDDLNKLDLAILVVGLFYFRKKVKKHAD
jgi:SAM-dependent methyltransferase